MTAATSAEKRVPQLAWVQQIDGQPRLRWPSILAVVLVVTAVNAISMGLTSWFTRTPLQLGFIIAMTAGTAVWLVVAIDLQRQRLQTGTWRMQFSLRTLCIVFVLISMFFAGLARDFHVSQRAWAAGQTLKGELEALIGGGQVYVSTPGRTKLTCQITRPDFDDEDLLALLRRVNGKKDCELNTIFLEGTSVTDIGIQELADCPRLVLLGLPAINLSDETTAALATCSNLEFLLLDEKRLTAEQVKQLRESLPNTRLNGRRWSER